MAATSLAERFFDKVERIPGFDCWIWTGRQNSTSEYGLLWEPTVKRTLFAHRLSYELHKGSIPPGLLVCHSCDVRLCVNPSHLWLGTDADNMRDMRNKGRGSPPPHYYGAQHHCGKRTHCPRGHEYTQENTYHYKGRAGRQCKTCVKARARFREAILKAARNVSQT